MCAFLHKLRDEAKYADLDILIRQIARDVADARQFFLAKHNIPLEAYSFHS